MKTNEGTKIVRAVVDEIEGDLALLVFAVTNRSVTVPVTFIDGAKEGDLVEITFKILKKDSSVAREEIADIISDLKER